MSNKSNRFFPEARERAVRPVQDHRGEYASLWAAIESIAPKIGCVPQTLHEWVRKQEINTGIRDGLTSDECERIKALESGRTKAYQAATDSQSHGRPPQTRCANPWRSPAPARPASG